MHIFIFKDALYKIDLITKQQSLVRKFTEMFGETATDIAIGPLNPSIIYLVHPSGNSSLSMVNKTTGVLLNHKLIVGNAADLHSITFDSRGTLYALQRSSTQTVLYSIDLTTFRATQIAVVLGIGNVRTAVALPRFVWIFFLYRIIVLTLLVFVKATLLIVCLQTELLARLY